jgi:hypothetical protein
MSPPARARRTRVPLVVRVASSSARLPSIRGARGDQRSHTSCKHALTEGASRSLYQTVPAKQEPGNIASGSPPVSARAPGRGNCRYAFSVAP